MTQHILGGRSGDSIRLGTAILLIMGLAGCSKSAPLDPVQSTGTLATSPSAAAAGGFGSATFYPLAPGNSWEYEGELRVDFVNPDGTPGGDPIQIQTAESDQIIGTEVRDGRTYFLREEILDESGGPYPGRTVTWSRMRQDRAGLFAADVNSDEPPALDAASARYAAPDAKTGRPGLDLSLLEARGFSKEATARFAERVERVRNAAMGWGRSEGATRAAQEGELTWLLYPLHTGREWNIRPDMPWPARVDGVEVIASKMGPLVAYRIEAIPLGEPLAEGEYVRFYYGRVGLIGYSLHLSAQATDVDGNPTGTAILDDTRRLVATGPNS